MRRITPSLTLPRKGGEDKSLPPSRGKARMGVRGPPPLFYRIKHTIAEETWSLK